MYISIRANHAQIARQIKALERAVLAFHTGIVGAAGTRAAVDSNLAIILSARLASVWKRIGRIVPSGPSILPTASRPVVKR